MFLFSLAVIPFVSLVLLIAFRVISSRSLLAFALTIVSIMSVAIGARAETAFYEALPSNKVTAVEATKTLATGKTAWKCERVKIGKNINPVKVPGSDATWHVADSLGKSIENVFEHMSSGKPAYRCAQMEANQANGRVRKASM